MDKNTMLDEWIASLSRLSIGAGGTCRKLVPDGQARFHYPSGISDRDRRWSCDIPKASDLESCCNRSAHGNGTRVLSLNGGRSEK